MRVKLLHLAGPRGRARRRGLDRERRRPCYREAEPDWWASSGANAEVDRLAGVERPVGQEAHAGAIREVPQTPLVQTGARAGDRYFAHVRSGKGAHSDLRFG